jgi:hypothetical protein
MPVATSYGTYLSVGPRRQLINCTTNISIAQPFSNIVNGAKVANNDNGFFCNSVQSNPGVLYWRWEFPSKVCMQEFTWYQSGASSQGIYTLQGSDDGSAWTDIVTGLDVGASTTTVCAFSGNDTFYKIYRLLQTSGSTNTSQWVTEVEFKLAFDPTDATGPATGATSYSNLYGQGARQTIIQAYVNHQTACNPSDVGDIFGMLDGSFSDGCSTATAFSNGWTDVIFTFAFPTAIVIDEFTWSQGAAASQGVYTIQGSLDGLTWSDLATGLTLGATATDVHAFTNVNAYRVYRLVQTSGASSATPWVREITFKTAEPSSGSGPGNILVSVSFTDDAGFSALPTLYHHTIPRVIVSFGDETAFTADATLTDAGPAVHIVFRVVDDGGFIVGAPFLSAPDKHPVADFHDDGGFVIAAPFLSAPDKHPVADFHDDGGFNASPSIIPVNGPFFFAWADQGEAFSSGHHAVIDEDVFSFTITQEEGDFAKATIVIRNPRVGLLSAGRKRWAFLSFKYDGLVVPMFYGRLVGLPSNIFDELVSIDFIARPFDFVARKKVLANAMRTLPYWEPIFINPGHWDDDDTVLEARTAHWAIDRVTHAVTISDLIEAEDGVIEFTADDYFYDGLCGADQCHAAVDAVGHGKLRSVRPDPEQVARQR